MSKATFPKKQLLMAVIADEATVTGFLLTGMGEKKNGYNFIIVDKEMTDQKLEEGFTKFLNDSYGVIFMAQSAADRMRSLIVDHQNNEELLVPTILEIPSKDAPYDPTKDSMLVIAAQKLYGQEAGI